MKHAAIVTGIELIAFFSILAGVVLFLLARFMQSIRSDVAARLTRAQHRMFEIRLREMIFKDPGSQVSGGLCQGDRSSPSI